MTLWYLEEARWELFDAVDYYERCAPGLGKRFDREVEAAESDILLHPELWSLMGRGYRRKLVRHFPYGLVYRLVGGDRIEVVAVMHLHRKPGYWRGRASSR